MWNELTILWNDLTIDWNDLTWNDLTMERNDQIPNLLENFTTLFLPGLPTSLQVSLSLVLVPHPW